MLKTYPDSAKVVFMKKTLGDDLQEEVLERETLLTAAMKALVESPTQGPIILDLLLKNGANINAQNRRLETPLSIAVQAHADVSLLNLLLDNKADHSLCDIYGMAPFIMFVRVFDHAWMF